MTATAVIPIQPTNPGARILSVSPDHPLTEKPYAYQDPNRLFDP